MKYASGIENGPPNININDLKIHITPKEDKQLKATVMLEYHGIKMKGFRVSRSIFDNDGNSLWVQPPSFNIGGKWSPIIYFEDKESWKDIEQMILQQYQNARYNDQEEVPF